MIAIYFKWGHFTIPYFAPRLRKSFYSLLKIARCSTMSKKLAESVIEILDEKKERSELFVQKKWNQICENTVISILFSEKLKLHFGLVFA